MNRKFTVSPDDPWYVDPTNTLAVMDYVRRHVDGSQHCTHGHGFTYDFCPIANGNLDLAVEALVAKDKKISEALQSLDNLIKQNM
jgi:hypothetical protein